MACTKGFADMTVDISSIRERSKRQIGDFALCMRPGLYFVYEVFRLL